MKAGTKLSGSQIYESNSDMLCSALKAFEIEDISVEIVGDDYNNTMDAFKRALTTADIVISSGGISVGEFDYVGKVLRDAGTETIFHRVAQKPGKPIYFGKTTDQLVFGLPGNPASALVGFYLYIYPAIQYWVGQNSIGLKNQKIELAEPLKNNSGRDCFYRGRIENGKVRSLDGQESFMLKSFALANVLIRIPFDNKNIEAGEMVDIYSLPLI